MGKKKIFLLKLLGLLGLLMLLFWALPSAAPARSGQGVSGGKSSGNRGPKSMKTARSPRPEVQPTTLSRSELAKTTATGRGAPSASQSKDSFWRGFRGGIWGGWTGGLLGRLLFGDPGVQGAKTGNSFDFGLLDLILLGSLGFLTYRLVTKARRQKTATPEGILPNNPVDPDLPVSDEQESPPPEPEWDLETGLRYIEQSDPLFSQQKFKDQALDNFFKIQGAWSDRNLSSVRHLLTKEMFDLLQQDAEKMRRDGLVNQLQVLGVREVNLTKAWQEAGQDYLTVRLHVTLLDYTLKERSGEILSGSKFEPVNLEEYWTLTRPSGNNPWQLSAISQVE